MKLLYPVDWVRAAGKDTQPLFQQRVNWLAEHIGPIGTGWGYMKQQFWFATESDAVLFTLKWA